MVVVCSGFRSCFNPATFLLTLVVVCCGVCAITAFGTYSYYRLFFPQTPQASLEHTGMYDYEEGDPTAKREAISSDFRYDDENEFDSVRKDEFVEKVKLFRNKRNISASSNGKDKTQPSTSTTIKSKVTTPEPPGKDEDDDEEPSFQASNVFVDAVFNHTDKENLTDSLGLCRKGAALKMPVQKLETALPPEEAAGMLDCINNILKNQTGKQICMQLDEELNAYVKWLVLTGEPKEKYKGPKLKTTDDFLFSSQGCAVPATDTGTGAGSGPDKIIHKSQC